MNYFGYGANSEARAIAAITGREEATLQGTPARLRSYGLAIQCLVDVPDSLSQESFLPVSPQDLLRKNWGEKFSSYVIYPKMGSFVFGRIWELTRDERERIRDFELVGDWYRDAVGVAETDGGLVTVVTEALGDGQNYGNEAYGLDYNPWLQTAEEFEKVAASVRASYDARMGNA